MRRAAILSLTLVAVLASPEARAQSEETTARADALFARGKAEMAAGQYTAACVLFGESYALDKAEGTLLALGLCHEQEGRSVLAWTELRDVLAAAVISNREDRQRVALAAIARVQAKVGRVGVRGRRCDVIEVDGKRVSSSDATVERPLAVEPGEHTLACAGWSTLVHVLGGALEVVTIPEQSPVAPVPRAAPPERTERGGGAVGWILGSAGVTSLGVGTFFAVRSFSSWDAVESKCPVPSACRDRTALADESDARTAAMVANITMVAGAVLAGAAIYFLATSK